MQVENLARFEPWELLSQDFVTDRVRQTDRKSDGCMGKTNMSSNPDRGDIISMINTTSESLKVRIVRIVFIYQHFYFMSS